MVGDERVTYLDLLDDGIPQGNPLLGSDQTNRFDQSLLANARFQVLLAVLFGARIVVPEPWLVSSPTFLSVLGEVATYYGHPHESRADGRVPPPVFLFGFFGDPVPNASVGSRFVEAFARRLETGRRVVALEGFLGDDPGRGADCRRDLAASLRKWVNNDGDWAPSAMTLASLLANRLRDYAGHRVAQDAIVRVSQAYGCVLDYCSRMGVHDLDVSWGPERVQISREVTRQHVHLVGQAVFSETEQSDEFVDELRAFRAFFDEARAKEISFADVMGMQRILSKYEPASKETIDAFGRYVLNRGYGVGAFARSSLVSFDFYPRREPTRFESWLGGQVMSLESLKNPRQDFAEFLESSGSRTYDLANLIDWPKAWATLGHVATDEKWLRKRQDVDVRLLQSTLSGMDEKQVWQELFDRVNGAFQDFSFRLDPSDRRIINVLFTTSELGSAMGPELAKIALEAPGGAAASILNITIPASHLLLRIGLTHVGGTYFMLRRARELGRVVDLSGRLVQGVSTLIASRFRADTQ